MQSAASDADAQRASLLEPALASRFARGDSTETCAGEAGMPATTRVGAADCSSTPAPPSTCTCVAEIGNESTS